MIEPAFTPVRPPELRLFLDPDEIVVDNFAGGGGASSGVAEGLGIEGPHIAINHDAEAIAMHKVNHPKTKHYIEDVWDVDPVEACAGRRVGLAWFSPDCTEFSRAKGGKPKDQKIRGLANIALVWAEKVRPRVICLENVEEFQKWGPLHEAHSHGCKTRRKHPRIKGHVTPPKCRKLCRFNRPIKALEGTHFQAFVAKFEALGYVVEWRLLRACDYGAPTTRRRLHLVARCDGKLVRWPAPTHGPEGSGLLPFRTAAECIDWTIPCPSIFGRERELADKTLARIARGIRKFVLEAAKPFIVPATHGDSNGAPDTRVHSVDEPLRTITTLGAQFHVVEPKLVPVGAFALPLTHHGDARVHDLADPFVTITGAHRGELALAIPYMVHRSNGERPPGPLSPEGQAPRIYDIQKPITTIQAQGLKHALCVAFLNKHHGGHESTTGGQAITEPIATIAGTDQKAVTVGHLTKLYGTSTGAPADAPMPTITGGGNHIGAVHAFLVRYNGQSGPEAVDKPISTIDTTDRHALVIVTIGGEKYVLVDIGMRMLAPRELYLGQGFRPDYVIDPIGPNGKPLSKTAQVRMVGNSVPPPSAAAVARAQFLEAA